MGKEQALPLAVGTTLNWHGDGIWTRGVVSGDVIDAYKLSVVTYLKIKAAAAHTELALDGGVDERG